MKKTFIVHFPIKQGINAGLSWAQINELSWEEINLLSWKDIAQTIKRYIDYSVQIAQKAVINVTFTLKRIFR